MENADPIDVAVGSHAFFFHSAANDHDGNVSPLQNLPSASMQALSSGKTVKQRHQFHNSKWTQYTPHSTAELHSRGCQASVLM